MKIRPFSLIAIALAMGLVGLVPTSPLAGEVEPFDAAAFAAAQTDGASVVVNVHAPW